MRAENATKRGGYSAILAPGRMTMRNLGVFLSSLALLSCGVGLVAIVALAGPDPLTVHSDYWVEWTGIGIAGLEGILMGGFGLIYSTE
jgi:hypothetical protein